MQWVIRPDAADGTDYRGYAGRLESGVVAPGDEVVVLPAGLRTRVERIDTFDGPLAEAFAPMSATLVLADDVDVARGDVVCGVADAPAPARELEADVCWMAERPLTPGGRYAIKHMTRTARAVVDELLWAVDVHTLDRDAGATSLRLNDIGPCGCGPRSRWWPTTTRATAAPARSSSSTRGRTTPLPRG